MQLAGGGQKKLWRCNQWWNKRCRSRVYTIGDLVTPLNKYHTHEDIIRRKKRVSRGRKRNSRVPDAGPQLAAEMATSTAGAIETTPPCVPEIVMVKTTMTTANM